MREAFGCFLLNSIPIREISNTEFKKLLQKRYEYIASKLELRNRDLMTAIRETQETQKIIAATQQKKWWEFWKR
jgi:hypothetical protein